MSAILDTNPSRGTNELEWMPVAAAFSALFVPGLYGLATTIWQTEDQDHGPVILVAIGWSTGIAVTAFVACQVGIYRAGSC